MQAVEDEVLAEGAIAMSQENAERLQYALLAISGTQKIRCHMSTQ